MAVIVNDGAAVAQLLALEANAGFAERAEADAFGENVRFFDVQNATAFGDDARGCGRIDMSIFAQFVRAAEDAIVRAREWRT